MPIDEDVIRYRISDVRSVTAELRRLASKPSDELGLDERYSLRYNLIMLVEATVALCIHIAVEDYGVTPRSYREAVRVVAEKLGVKCVRDLEALVGLRNLLIHRYWVIEDEKIHENIRKNFKCIEELLEKPEEAYLGRQAG